MNRGDSPTRGAGIYSYLARLYHGIPKEISVDLSYLNWTPRVPSRQRTHNRVNETIIYENLGKRKQRGEFDRVLRSPEQLKSQELRQPLHELGSASRVISQIYDSSRIARWKPPAAAWNHNNYSRPRQLEFLCSYKKLGTNSNAAS